MNSGGASTAPPGSGANQPVEIVQRGRQAIRITWGDGHESTFPFPLLRRECRCAACRTLEPPPERPGNPFRVLGPEPSAEPAVVEPVGNYALGVTWRDQHGLGNSGDLVVTVDNVAPTVLAGGDTTVLAGSTFTRNGFFTDAGILDTWTATVDYGDGSGVQPLDLNPTGRFHLQHRYTAPGTYTVTVAVRDDDDGVGTARFTVTVLPRPGREALDALFALLADDEDGPR